MRAPAAAVAAAGLLALLLLFLLVLLLAPVAFARDLDQDPGAGAGPAVIPPADAAAVVELQDPIDAPRPGPSATPAPGSGAPGRLAGEPLELAGVSAAELASSPTPPPRPATPVPEPTPPPAADDPGGHPSGGGTAPDLRTTEPRPVAFHGLPQPPFPDGDGDGGGPGPAPTDTAAPSAPPLLAQGTPVPPPGWTPNPAGVGTTGARRVARNGALIIPPTSATAVANTYKIVPILFVPTDWSVSDPEVQAEAAALDVGMREVRNWYDQQFNDTYIEPPGVHPIFTLAPLAVVQGNGPKEQYYIQWTGGNIYTDGIVFTGNMEDAVRRELAARGFPTTAETDLDGSRVVIFVKGAGGYAGGTTFAETGGSGGYGLLGDWAIDSIQGQVPVGAYWWSGRDQQLGAVAHELGHALGLQHPNAHNPPWPDGTIMSHPNANYLRFPKIGLTALELKQLYWPRSTP